MTRRGFDMPAIYRDKNAPPVHPDAPLSHNERRALQIEAKRREELRQENERTYRAHLTSTLPRMVRILEGVKANEEERTRPADNTGGSDDA